MAAEYTFVSSRFPNGTVVYANAVGAHDEPVAATVYSGAATFSGLREYQAYVARATVNGANIFASFTTGGGPQTGSVDLSSTVPVVRAFARQPVGSGMTIARKTSAGLLTAATSTITGSIVNPDTAGWPGRSSVWLLQRRTDINSTPAWMPKSPHKSDGTDNTVPNPWHLDLDWYTAAGAVGIGIYGAAQVRVIIDGNYAQLAPVQVGTDDFNWAWIELSGVTAGYHQVRVEFSGNWVVFGGLKLATADSIFPTSIPTSKRLSIVGDSFGVGFTTPTNAGLGTAAIADIRGYAPQLARLLGFSDFCSHSDAGTGFTTPTGPPSRLYSDRIVDVVAANPDYLLIQGSTNDYGQRATTLPSLALSTYQAYKAALPNARILATGAMHTSSATNSDAVTGILATAAGLAGVEFLDTTGWGSTANAALTYSVDGTHPTLDGHAYLAARLARSLAERWKLPL